MTPRTLFIAFALPLLPAMTVARPKTPEPIHDTTVCTCDDLTDLINRLHMAELAIQALNGEIAKLQNAERTSGRKIMMDTRGANGQTAYETIKTTIIEAMSTVQMGEGSTSEAETDANCKASLKRDTYPGTPCMDEVVMWHEQQVHVKECSTQVARGGTTLIGRRAQLPAIDYAREEIRGYESEIAKIREILRGLPDTCTGDWIGRLYFFEKKTSQHNEILPPVASRIRGEERASSDFVREAKFLFSEAGSSFVNQTLTFQFSKTIVVTGIVDCTSGPGGERSVTTTSEWKNDFAGSSREETGVSLNFDPQTGQYSILANVPPSSGSGTATESHKAQGSCVASDDRPQGGSASGSTDFAGMQAEATGRVSPTAREITGQKTFDWAPQASIPNTTVKHTGTLSWVFYRIR